MPITKVLHRYIRLRLHHRLSLSFTYVCSFSCSFTLSVCFYVFNAIPTVYTCLSQWLGSYLLILTVLMFSIYFCICLWFFSACLRLSCYLLCLPLCKCFYCSFLSICAYVSIAHCCLSVLMFLFYFGLSVILYIFVYLC